MKTTIDLPDSLAHRAKELAREQRVSLRELVTEGLRAELERRSAPRVSVEFRFTTAGGDGLRADVDPATLTQHAYELPR